MIDQYGRNIEYLRVSVTDLCNLRCVYCMPKDGITQVPHSQILTYDEITKICSICAKKGISKIKITGGEPLVRKGIDRLIKELKSIQGIEEVTLTTNGILLAEQLDGLVEAGLDAVNISLDTLDEEQYKTLTRQGDLEEALRGLEAALKYTRLRVKINCVALHGSNEEQWIKLAAFAEKYPVDVRFIEMMPIGMGRAYMGSSQENILESLATAYGSYEAISGDFGNGPAVYKKFHGFLGKIGFISAVSHEFCGECNRVRLTAEGFLKPCLQYATGADLRAVIRGTGEMAEIESLIEKVIYEKPRCHQFGNDTKRMEIDKEDICLEEKHMSRIGG